jgi:SnoaL-like domain
MQLEELVDERAIYRQLVSFARAMDDRNWQVIESILSENAKADFGMGEIQGSTTIVEFIRSFLDNCGTTQHILGNIIIDIDGDTATSRAYVSDMHLPKNTDSDISFRTLGDYSDKWARVNGTWLITERVKDNRATLGSMDVFKP